MSFNPVFWRNDLFSLVDLAQSLAIIGIDQTKLEFRHPRKLVPRFLNLRSVEPGDLDQNSVIRDGTDDRFADSKSVNTFPNHLHGLIKHSLGDRLVPRLEPDQEGRAALNIQAQRDLFL